MMKMVENPVAEDQVSKNSMPLYFKNNQNQKPGVIYKA